MKLSANVTLLVLGLVLLVIAIPFGLVQLDILDATRLRIIPSLIAVILALGALGLFVAQLRAGRRNK